MLKSSWLQISNGLQPTLLTKKSFNYEKYHYFHYRIISYNAVFSINIVRKRIFLRSVGFLDYVPYSYRRVVFSCVLAQIFQYMLVVR